MKKLSVMLCLIALLAFTLNGCGGSGTTDTSYYGGGDSGGTTTTPTVTSCTTNLTPGQTCSIGGSGFGSSRDSGASTVSFVPQVTGGTTLTATTYLSWSDTAIQCVTPSVVTGIQYVVIVNRYTSSGTVSSSSTGSSANMTTGTAATAAPSVTSQSPNPATAGASVTLTGTNFPISYGYILVNGTAVSSTFTTTTAVFTVPSTVTANATVTLGGGTGGSTTYTLVVGSTSTVQITSINPSTVPASTVIAITITGTGFGTTAGTVNFGSTPVTAVTSWSATSIVVNTPATLAQGTTQVTVTAGGVTSNQSPLTVVSSTTPVITNITPSSIQQGGTVTITGVNFGAAQGTGFVTFGTVNQTVAGTWNATTISCVVPTTVAAGACNVTVTPSSGTASAAYSITVTTTPVVTGTWHSPATTISGNNGCGPNAQINLHTFPNGNLASIYVDQVAAGRNGVVAQYFLSTTGTWSTQTEIGLTTNGLAALCNEPVGLTTSMDGTGNIMAVWEQNTAAAGTPRILFQYYNYGTGAWNTSVGVNFVDTANSPGAIGAARPAIAHDNVGNCVCVWLQGTAGTNTVIANKYTGGTWLNTPCQIQIQNGAASNGVTNEVNPVIAFKPGTQVGYAGWVQRSNAAAANGVYVRRVDTTKSNTSWNVLGAADSSWGTNAARVDAEFGGATNDCSAIRMAFNTSNGMLTFEKDTAGVQNLYVSQYNSTADQFNTIASLTSALNSSAIAAGTPRTAYLSNGNALSVWQDGAGTRPIYASTYNGTTWSAGQAIQCLTGATLVGGGAPALRCDASGNAFCTFLQQQTTSAIEYLYAARYSSGTWTRPNASTDAIDGNTTANCCVVPAAITFNTAGNAWVLFTQGIGGVNKIFSNRYY